MRKRILAGLLTVALALSLLPTAAFAATGTAIVDVYSLADIKSAANQDQVRIIRLMKDIDASKENVTYDGDGFNTNSAIGRLASGCVLNGNGHTIYNLRGPLFANNMGNIHDLNVTLVNSDDNSDIFAPGGYPLLSGIASWNDYRGVGGVIENCTVTMNVKRDFGNVGGDWLSIDGISQGGTIRNCIAKLNIDLKLDSNAYGGISVRGIGFGYNNSLTDHCLVLGSVKITSPQSSNADAYFTGISDGTTQDSACALDTLSITAKSARNDPYEHFTLGSGSEGTGTRNRAASDMNVNYTFNNQILLSGTPTTASGNYTLDTRPNILKDWDLSQIPAETPPTDTPIQSDPNDIPDDYIPIYTLADLKTKTHDGYYLLMNDIDASQEDVKYDGNGYNANSVCGRLFSGGVLNGNGHTIYNLRGALFECNMGTICNLNVTLSNTDKDTDTFGAGKSLAGIALSNFNGAAEGLIENCTVTMTVNRTFGKLAGSLSINGISSGGTIRNCIAKLNIYLDPGFGPEGPGTISISGIGSGNNNSLVDHCLVLGSIGIPNGLSTNKQPVHFNGISACTAQDSACALQRLVVHTRTVRQDPYEYFTLSSGGTSLAGTGSIRNRVANDMKVDYFFNGQGILGGPPNTKAGTYTLDTRANILKDWDLSVLPDPDTLLKTDFTRGTAEFHFMGNYGKTRTWQFDYDDNYFYGQEDGFGYDADLAKASVCLEMASFSAHVNSNWDRNLSADNLTRAENIRELYHTLGFDPETYQFVNYDIALTDTSDKAAYSMAMKYIQNPDGSTDTLIAVPIRGGGYGGEWVSNFHVWKNASYYGKNHTGFQAAADGVFDGLKTYVKNHTIKGNLKLWVAGYSRGAAVANLLGHMLNDAAMNNSMSGAKMDIEDIYVYTFATPAGATVKSATSSYDPNIYNIVNPIDLVPHVAPLAWGFTRYGTTLTLPSDNNNQLWTVYQQISSLEAPKNGDNNSTGLPQSQRLLISQFDKEVFTSTPVPYSAFGHKPYLDLQQGVMNFAKKQLATPDACLLTNVLSSPTILGIIAQLGHDNPSVGIRTLLSKNTIGNAHFLEYYLARLETDGLQDESDFDAVSRTRSVRISAADGAETRNKNFQVSFLSASGRSAGTYAAGVCTSGEVSVEMTDIGLIATFPAGADYTFTVSGADAGKLAMSIYAYDDMELDPARTMDFNSLPSTNGSPCTVYVPEDPYDEFYAEDANGKEYVPDSDSEYPDRVDSPAFTDVPADAYFYDAVEWAVEEGITSGTSPTTFSPNNGCTRAQMVTFLWRAAGSPEPESDYGPFRDVPKDAYYRKAVLWAAGEGITSGTSPTTFSPNATVTRAQTVTFLWRWEGEPEADQRSGFRDVPTGQYYSEAVSWAVEAGITNGTGTTTFSPGQTCTRAQIVTFLWRDMA